MSEEKKLQGDIICECELVTRTMIENAAKRNPVLTLDDLRRDVRLGKGPCQGGFCTYRATAVLHEMDKAGTWQADSPTEWDVAHLQSPAHNLVSDAADNSHSEYNVVENEAFNPNLLLRDFLQERWKGITPILWGRQLKQERLDELIYMSLMNVDHLPDKELRSPVTEFYNFDMTPDEESGND